MSFITLGKEIITTRGIRRVWIDEYETLNWFDRSLGEKPTYFIRVHYRNQTYSISYDNAKDRDADFKKLSECLSREGGE